MAPLPRLMIQVGVRDMRKCVDRTAGMGYVETMNWLEWMSRRYEQHKCLNCGKWHIWHRKAAHPQPTNPDDTEGIEVVTRYERGKGDLYSVDSGETWLTKQELQSRSASPTKPEGK
jgi:hypothetical protein